MAAGIASVMDLDRGVTAADRATAVTMTGIILISVTLWLAFNEEAIKYILYTIPFTLTAAYLIINHWQVRVHGPAVGALGLYLACAVASMVVNAWFGFYAVRDVAIIGGYLFLFVLWFRAPSSTADLGLAALAIGLIVEATTEGVAEEVNLFGSNGILESTLAFPLGVIALYYLHFGRWGRALAAGVLLFLAFKRITFVAVVLAVGFDIVIARYARLATARAVALLGVLTFSVAALFSTQLFELVSNMLQLERTSADSISLGRYNIATMLWQELLAGSPIRWMLGSGPGAADALVTAHFQLVNPHNDWLKILFDYGVVGFIAMHVVLYRILAEHRLSLMLYIYGAVVMMTDNILIYMFYHPFVLLMLSAARRQPVEGDG